MFEVNANDELIDVIHHFLTDTKTDRDTVKNNNSTETCRIKGCYEYFLCFFSIYVSIQYNIFYKLSSATRQAVLSSLFFVNIGTFFLFLFCSFHNFIKSRANQKSSLRSNFPVLNYDPRVSFQRYIKDGTLIISSQIYLKKEKKNSSILRRMWKTHQTSTNDQDTQEILLESLIHFVITQNVLETVRKNFRT